MGGISCYSFFKHRLGFKHKFLSLNCYRRLISIILVLTFLISAISHLSSYDINSSQIALTSPQDSEHVSESTLSDNSGVNLETQVDTIEGNADGQSSSHNVLVGSEEVSWERTTYFNIMNEENSASFDVELNYPERRWHTILLNATFSVHDASDGDFWVNITRGTEVTDTTATVSYRFTPDLPEEAILVNATSVEEGKYLSLKLDDQTISDGKEYQIQLEVTSKDINKLFECEVVVGTKEKYTCFSVNEIVVNEEDLSTNIEYVVDGDWVITREPGTNEVYYEFSYELENIGEGNAANVRAQIFPVKGVKSIERGEANYGDIAGGSSQYGETFFAVTTFPDQEIKLDLQITWTVDDVTSSDHGRIYTKIIDPSIADDLSFSPKWTFDFKGITDSRSFIICPDLNGDGYDDILVLSRISGGSYYNVTALTHNGEIIWNYTDFNPRYTTYDGLNVRGIGNMSWYYQFYDENDDGVMDILGWFSNYTMGILNGKTGEVLWMGEPFGSRNLATVLLEDFTGDGKPEIIMRGPGYDYGVLNSSDKTLIWSNTYGYEPHLHSIPDVDGDGIWDVVTGANYVDRIHCWSGANGSLLWTSIDIGFDSWGEAVCPDQNDDGVYDILVAPQNGAGDDTFKLLSGSDGTELWDTSYTRLREPEYIIDENGTGYALVDDEGTVRTFYLENGTQIGDISGTKWTGDHKFLFNPNYDPSIFTMVFKDSDNSLEIYSIDNHTTPIQTIGADWSLQVGVYYGTNSALCHDLILANSTHLVFYSDLYSDYGEWNLYTRFNVTWDNDASSGMKTPHFIDLNDDGKLELLRDLPNYETEVYRLTENGYVFYTNISIRVYEFGDYDGDGTNELVGRLSSGDYNYYFYNFSWIDKTLNLETTWVTGYDDSGMICFGDLEDDGKEEFMYADNGGDPPRRRLISFTGTNFIELQSFDDPSTQGWDGYAEATMLDIDGDGRDEIVCGWGYGSLFDGGIRIFDDHLNSYTLLQQYQFERDPTFLDPFDDHEDLNGDGNEDLVAGMAHTGVDSYRYMIWYNSTASSFTYQKLLKQALNQHFGYGVGTLSPDDVYPRYVTFFSPSSGSGQHWSNVTYIYTWLGDSFGDPIAYNLDKVYSMAYLDLRLSVRDINGDGYDEIIWDGSNAAGKQVTFFVFNELALKPTDSLAEYINVSIPSDKEFSEDFNDGTADGWVIVEGEWSIENGKYHGNATASGVDARSYYSLHTLSNFTYEGDIMLLAGDQLSLPFLIQDIYPGRDNGHYYQIVHYNESHYVENIKLGHVANGHTWIKQETAAFQYNESYHFKLVVSGSNLEYYLNDTLVLTYDSLVYSEGFVGAKVIFSGTHAYFDNLRTLSPTVSYTGGSTQEIDIMGVTANCSNTAHGTLDDTEAIVHTYTVYTSGGSPTSVTGDLSWTGSNWQALDVDVSSLANGDYYIRCYFEDSDASGTSSPTNIFTKTSSGNGGNGDGGDGNGDDTSDGDGGGDSDDETGKSSPILDFLNNFYSAKPGENVTLEGTISTNENGQFITVNFEDKVYGVYTSDNGKFEVTVTAPSEYGTYKATAKFAGDENWESASTICILLVVQETTQMDLDVEGNLEQGEQITIKVTVKKENGDPIIDGKVTIYIYERKNSMASTTTATTTSLVTQTDMGTCSVDERYWELIETFETTTDAEGTAIADWTVSTANEIQIVAEYGGKVEGDDGENIGSSTAIYDEAGTQPTIMIPEGNTGLMIGAVGAVVGGIAIGAYAYFASGTSKWVDAINTGGRMSIMDLAKQFNKSDEEVRAMIHKLESKGKICGTFTKDGREFVTRDAMKREVRQVFEQN